LRRLDQSCAAQDFYLWELILTSLRVASDVMTAAHGVKKILAPMHLSAVSERDCVMH
jgi:hypothetical protein